ncbi:hypothetical protein WUBG_15825, partial [Wuchereria bancrofti]
ADEEAFDGADEDEPVMDLFRLQKCKHEPYRACKPSFIPEQVEKRRTRHIACVLTDGSSVRTDDSPYLNRSAGSSDCSGNIDGPATGRGGNLVWLRDTSHLAMSESFRVV